MWKKFRIRLCDGEIKCKVEHPADGNRFLYFTSDFPHLIRCLRNSFLKHGFFMVDGGVKIEFINATFKEDQNCISLKAMSNIAQDYLTPNSFDKMRMSYAL